MSVALRQCVAVCLILAAGQGRAGLLGQSLGQPVPSGHLGEQQIAGKEAAITLHVVLLAMTLCCLLCCGGVGQGLMFPLGRVLPP